MNQMKADYIKFTTYLKTKAKKFRWSLHSAITSVSMVDMFVCYMLLSFLIIIFLGFSWGYAAGLANIDSHLMVLGR